jgi:hypothetical protein
MSFQLMQLICSIINTMVQVVRKPSPNREMWRKWVDAVVCLIIHHANKKKSLYPSLEEDSWMASSLRSYCAPLSPPEEILQLVATPLVKSIFKLVRKTVVPVPQPSENYLVCKQSCLLTERTHGGTERLNYKTHCCFSTHCKDDPTILKKPRLSLVPKPKRNQVTYAYTTEAVELIKHLFKIKCTAIQSITVAIMCMDYQFKTHLLDTTMVYSHRHYIVMNPHGVMYSRLNVDDKPLALYHVELGEKLVWITSTRTPQRPVIHFENDKLVGEYLLMVRQYHKKMYDTKLIREAGIFIV